MIKKIINMHPRKRRNIIKKYLPIIPLVLGIIGYITYKKRRK